MTTRHNWNAMAAAGSTFRVLAVAAGWASILATPNPAWGAASASSAPATPVSASRPHDSAGTTSPAGTEAIQDIDLLSLQVPEVPMVVTATRREQKITTVPYAISVVTADDIRSSGARSVPDALRLVPGVDVADLASGAYAVSPRGFQGLLSNDVVVLVDGRQIFDSVFGGTLWASWPFQMEDIDRIEVIRGPGGVTWGANTINGVINIITKDPKNQTGVTTTAGGGSRGAQKEHVGYGVSDGPLRMRVSGEYEANDGFTHGGSFLRKLDDDLKDGRMGLHAVYDASPNDKVTVSGGSALLDGGYPPTPGAGFGLRHNSESQAEFLLGKWEHTIARDNRLNVTGFVNDFQACPGVPAMDYRYQQFALQIGHVFKPAEAHTITWGIDSRTDLVDASNSDPFMLSQDFVSTAIIGLYVQDDWQFAPKWTLSTGGRIDYEFYGGFEPSARMALSHELPDKSFVYGAVSRAFLSPSAGVRFVDIPLLNGLVRATSERDLPQATVLAYELGWRKTFFDRLDANVNVFWNDYHHLGAFVPGPGPPGLLQYHFDDVVAADTYGAELETKYTVSKKLTLLGNYTYQQLNWNAPVPPGEKDMMTLPRHKFMLGARYDPMDDLHLSSHLYYVDAVRAPNPTLPFFPRHVPQYFRLDLRAEYEFWKKRASVSVGVKNLLDANHAEGSSMFINNAEVPRMIYAEFRMTIK